LKASGLTESEKKDRLLNAIQIMKLEKAQDNFVGGIYRKGISGGEKKRLNIGFELLGDPNIIFLDEPTSGLDSYTSFIIMTVLRQIAIDNNIIVVYTIHQPSIETFNLFDNLMILDRGKNIYFGKATGAIDYYAKMDYPVPANTNPANHFITLALRSPEKNEMFYQNFNSTILPQIQEEIQRYQVTEPFVTSTVRVGFFSQYRILLVRAFKNFSRNPMATIIRMVQTVFMIVIFCMLYFRMSEDFSNNINVINRQGAFFLLSINLFISYFQNYLLVCELTSP
jgi:ABC-type multidrug transport system ATPase subunit